MYGYIPPLGQATVNTNENSVYPCFWDGGGSTIEYSRILSGAIISHKFANALAIF